MASQKQTRAASGRGSGTATRPGAGSGRAQDGQARGSRSQNGQAGSGRGQGGQARGRSGQGRPAATQARPAAQADLSPATRASAPRFSAPLWFQITTLVLSLAGMGVSIYLTIAHYTSASILACSADGLVDCAKVTTSAESVVFGIFPVAVLGLAFYIFMVAINTPWAWRSGLPLIAWARTGGIIAGMGFVLYLVYAEVIEIGNICLWCTSVHVVTFLLFVLLMSVAPFGSRARAAAAGTR
jgi:uncharacterized membrane protein